MGLFNCPNTRRNEDPGARYLLFRVYGSLGLVLCRVIVLVICYATDQRNKRLLNTSNKNADVLLPLYYNILCLYVGISAVLAVFIAVAPDYTDDPFVISFEAGFEHWFIYGILFFFMQNGAGIQDMTRAFSFSGGAAAFYFSVTLVSSILEVDYQKHAYSFGLALSLIAIEICVLIFILVNSKSFRPTAALFAQNVFFLNIASIAMTVAAFTLSGSTACILLLFYFIFEGIITPFVLFRGLLMESKYWQGIFFSWSDESVMNGTEATNPMQGVWDHLNIPVVMAMTHVGSRFSSATQKNSLSRSNNSEDKVSFVSKFALSSRLKYQVPYVHFGMLTIDYSAGYVTGGSSRVYMAKLRNQGIALKMLFAIELTPETIFSFREEAEIMCQLSSPHVLKCYGISVMPPAICLALEYCHFGSLFDFLYGSMTATPVLFATPWDIQAEIGRNSWKSKDTFLNSENLSRKHFFLGSNTKDAHPISFSRMSDYMSNQLSSIDSVTYGVFGNAKSISVPRSDDSAPLPDIIELGESMKFSNDGMPSSKVSSRQTMAAYTYIQMLDMMIGAVKGVQHLHENRILHCDIKSLNFLVDENLCVKLSDFGEARSIDAPIKFEDFPKGTLNWCPPECLVINATADMYTAPSEVYCLSIVLSEILLRKVPFDGVQTIREMKKIIVEDIERPVLPDKMPAQLKSVIMEGWSQDPLKRPLPRDILLTLEAEKRTTHYINRVVQYLK